MTDIPDTKPIYPSNWRPLDIQANIEVRNLSDDTYQMRSPTHTITIPSEGFNLFREETSEAWNKYLKDNNIKSVPREDLE